ncbi:hypothetical protein H5410_051077 [Solanum commersonii]|uniref:Uncharacterized protein n=1 Tax=Solanum commersonii TaxID=4109 RepID=A0A9J5WXE4_SOLCO|nr:hypothetical protein H5410_051077 [Solanum commersonii]
MFIIIIYKIDAYSSKLEFVQRNHDLQVGLALTWNVGIGQMASAISMQHQLRPARSGRGMCASG